jgi:Tfp pilus assembly protein PilF
MIVNRNPEWAGGWHEYGRTLLTTGRNEEAEQKLRRAVSLERNHHYLNNLALALMRQGRADEAIPPLLECLRIEPNYSHGLNNLGWAYEETGQLDESVDTLRRAVRACPDHVHAHYILGRTLIAQGKLEEGWREYEWRWRVPTFPSRKREFDLPEWDGSAPAGKRFLLWAEQGIGDQMAFSSMIRDLIAAGATGAIECASKLVSLFRRSFPGFSVYAQSQEPAREISDCPFDFQMPLGGLGQYLRRNVSDFPERSGHLIADECQVSRWRERLDQLDDNVKVGLAWTSRNRVGFRARHYLTIEDLEPVFRVPGCTFICVQFGDCTADMQLARERFGTKLIAFDDLDLFDDIDGTVAMTRALDAGVSSKFSSCLDVMAVNDLPVLTFSRGVTERNMGTDRIPWYPAARVFHCETGADVAPVVQTMAEAL